MIRGILRLALVGLAVGWVADRWLRVRAGGLPPPPFSSLVVIDAPIDRVWTALADIEAQPRWMVRIFGLGTTDPVEITEFQPPHRFAIRHEGTFTGGGLITLESGADGSTTIVRWDETLIAPFLPHAWALAAAPVMTGIFQADLLRFRDLVESGG